MLHPTDYLDSAIRWRDAVSQWDSVDGPEGRDHLAGLAAECACKVLIRTMGAKLAYHGGLADHRLRVHLPYVFDELRVQLAGRNAPAVSAHLPDQNPFKDWSIDARYAANGSITDSAAEAHRRGVEQLFRGLQAAALDGELG